MLRSTTLVLLSSFAILALGEARLSSVLASRACLLAERNAPKEDIVHMGVAAGHVCVSALQMLGAWVAMACRAVAVRVQQIDWTTCAYSMAMVVVPVGLVLCVKVNVSIQCEMCVCICVCMYKKACDLHSYLTPLLIHAHTHTYIHRSANCAPWPFNGACV